MALLVGVAQDKLGNILPNITILVRERGYVSPSGTYAGPVITDAIGNYRITVSKSGTEYNVFVNSESGDITGPNFIGTMISSGDVVSSFTLLDDSDWKIEHYGNGEAQTAGTHKAINLDSATFRTGGFAQTADSFFELRVGGTTSKFRITKTVSGANVYWLDPYPVAGSLAADTGLREGYDSSVRLFRFGTAGTFTIGTNGNFRLNGGRFDAAITFYGAITFDTRTTFPSSVSGYPQVDTYVAPTDDKDLVPKKYVDDEIAASTGTFTHRDYLLPMIVEVPLSSNDCDVSAPFSDSTDQVPFRRIKGNDDTQNCSIAFYTTAKRSGWLELKLRYYVETASESVDFYVYNTAGTLIDSSTGNNSTSLATVTFNSAAILAASLTVGDVYRVLATANVNTDTKAYIGDCAIKYS